MTLAAGDIDATFLPGVGMVGVSLRRAGRQHLSLHGGIDAYRAGHTTGLPLLAPWANRLGGDRYRSGRTTVELAGAPELHRDPAGLPIHGTMVGPRVWQVEQLCADDPPGTATLVARFAFGAHPELLASFPFPHDLVIAATVTAEGLTVATSVEPTGRRSVPVSFGWHPYLRLPGVARRDVVVHLPARRRLVLDGAMVPTGEEVPERAEAEPLGRRSFDHGYRLGRSRRMALSGGGSELVVTFDAGYPFAQVYAPPGRAYVALEPMTAPANALVTGEHPVVAPGSSFTATFNVALGEAPDR